MSHALNKNCSLVSKDVSTWVKGILIFLIVLGHNMAFTCPLEKWGVMSYLYTFHIHIFFLLPFLYGAKKFSWKQTGIYFFRFYWPFCVFLIMIALVYGCANDFRNWSFNAVLHAFLLCNAEDLRMFSGVSMLWFLPAIMMTLILRDCYYSANNIFRCMLLFFSALANIYFVLVLVNANFQKLPYDNLPMGAFSAIRYLMLGVIIRKLMSFSHEKSFVWVILICLLIFGLGTYIYFTEVAMCMNKEVPLFHILQIMMPIPVLIVLCCLSDSFKQRSSLFMPIGHESMVIYLVSPFIGYAAYYGLRLVFFDNWLAGVLVQPIIIFLSLVIAKKLISGKIRNILLPRSFSDFKSTFTNI